MAHPLAAKNGKSLSEKFARAARRFVAPILFTGLFGAPLAAHAQEKPGTTQQQSTLTAEEKELLNQQITIGAILQAPDLLKASKTRLSASLEKIANHIHARQKQKTPNALPVVVLNPYQFDIGMALGLDAETTVGYMFKEQDYFPNPQNRKEITEQLYLAYRSPYNDTIPILKPGVFTQEGDGPKTMPPIFSPANGYVMAPGFSALSQDDYLVFANLHEAAHALERWYGYDGINFALAAKFNPLDAESVALNLDGLRYFTIKHKKESYADVAALGEMLKLGHDADIFRKVIASRSDSSSPVYLNAPAIIGLQKEIEKMGMKEFLKLDDDARDVLYYRVNEKYTLDHHGMKAALEYVMNADRLIHDSNDAALKSDDRAQNAIAFAQLMLTSAPEETGGDRVFQPDIDKKLKDWDPDAQLLLHAFKSFGIVTPQTVIVAYGDMMDKLAEERRTAPKDANLTTAKMIRLKQAFVNNLTNYDFVETNLFYGVPLEALKKIDETFVMPPVKKQPPLKP